MTDEAQVDTVNPPQMTGILNTENSEPKLRGSLAQNKKPFFNKANALEMQRRGVVAKREKAERIKLELADEQLPPPPAPNELDLALAECVRLSEALSGKRLAPLERAELSKALDRMLDRVRIIRGQPAPGTMTSRAPAPTPSTGARMLEAVGGSPAPISAPVPREEQE